MEAIAQAHGISVDEARQLIDRQLAETRRAAEEYLAAHPKLQKQFEAAYEQDRAHREQHGRPVQDREAFLRGCALSHQARQRIRSRRKKIRTSEVAETAGGQLPPGWDDLLPPEAIENDAQK